MFSGKVVLVSLLVLGIWASVAQAEPLSMTFTEGRANVGDQLSVANDDDALFKAPDTAPFAARIDGSGSITSGVLHVPEFSKFVTDPVDAEVTVAFEIGTITGNFNQATGALTGSGTAGGTLTADGRNCIVSTTPAVLTLSSAGSTGGASSLSGAPFTAGLTGPGAIAGQWTDMHATPVTPDDATVCGEVEERIGGPGGVWLEQVGDNVPPAAPWLGTDPVSPSSSGTPRIRGGSEPGSTVRVYAGPSCAGVPLATVSAAELGTPGVAAEVAEGATAAFSATATDAAGNISACSAAISYTRLKASPPPPPPPPLTSTCTVPKLVGKTLANAKKALKAANCKLGKVTKPKRVRGKKQPALVVKSSSPRRGAKPADGKVDIKLGPKPKPKAKPKKPRR